MLDVSDITRKTEECLTAGFGHDESMQADFSAGLCSTDSSIVWLSFLAPLVSCAVKECVDKQGCIVGYVFQVYQ